MKKALITGITSQDGAYLSEFLLKKDYEILGLGRDCRNLRGLNYLNIASRVMVEECDLLDKTRITKIFEKFKPDEIYNLAAQSSVGQSFANPSATILFNLTSVLNLLECVKSFDKRIKFYQASSSEMFGKASHLPITEETAMHPLSPYGISKAAAHWTTIHFREAFGLKAYTGILFNHESFLRKENFFIKKLLRECLELSHGERNYITLGNIDIRRDFGFALEYIKAMWLIVQSPEPDDYIICSGMSISLRSIVEYVFNKLHISLDKLVIDKGLFRPAEIKDIYGDNSKAKNKLGWKYELDFYQVIDILIAEEQKNISMTKSTSKS